MKKVGCFIAIQLVGGLHSQTTSIPDIIKAHENKPCSAYYNTGQFSTECDGNFLTSLAKKATKISIRELLHVVTEAKEISVVRNSNPRLISKKDMEEAVKRSLARKKEADKTDSSWVPSGESLKNVGNGILQLLSIVATAQQIKNGSGGNKINSDSDLAAMKKD